MPTIPTGITAGGRIQHAQVAEGVRPLFAPCFGKDCLCAAGVDPLLRRPASSTHRPDHGTFGGRIESHCAKHRFCMID